jgi:5-methylcytosine-specific restriction endonuclease McrA
LIVSVGKSKQLAYKEHRIYSKYGKYAQANKKNNKTFRKQHLIDENTPFDTLFYWSREVRIKDGHKCVICEKTRKLTSHHLFSKSKHPLLKYNIGNGVVLCYECHSELHQLNDTSKT